jgi:LPXTG-motif cell wall-anchored protein
MGRQFTLTARPDKPGTYRYRALVPNESEAGLSGVSATIVVEVTDGDVLPVTGTPLTALLVLAIALVGVGGVILLAVRRRRIAKLSQREVASLAASTGARHRAAFVAT